MGSDSESLGAVDLMQNSLARANVTGLAVLITLFGLLLLASHSNELLRQIVIAPGSSADLGVEAACRADELEEEQLSLQECRLMVVDVQIVLSSSPAWFRPYQMTLSSFGIAAALFSIVTAFGLINRQSPPFRSVAVSMGILLLIELGGFSCGSQYRPPIAGSISVAAATVVRCPPLRIGSRYPSCTATRRSR